MPEISDAEFAEFKKQKESIENLEKKNKELIEEKKKENETKNRKRRLSCLKGKHADRYRSVAPSYDGQL